MRLRPLHLAILTLGLLASVGAAEPETDKGSSGSACLIEQAYRDVQDSIRATLDSARESAHTGYTVDRYAPAPALDVESAAHREHAEMWEPIDPDDELPAHAVVLVHGLDEVGGIWSDTAPRLHREGFAVLRFRYPNDARISPNADQFASHLAELRSRGVVCIDLVCHSMGGLVSLELLTREGLYGGIASGHNDLPDVRRLITVGTPFHGSPVAPLRPVTEIREQLSSLTSGPGTLSDRALRFLYDGTGGAGTDLTPGSDFLKELHARPLPEGVRMTAIVGRMETDGLSSWREGVLTDGFVPSVIGEKRAKSILTVTEGASRSIGDGVVPISSATLEGVDDVVVHRADHRSLIKHLDAPKFVRNLIGAPEGVPPAIPTILERLREECGCVNAP